MFASADTRHGRCGDDCQTADPEGASDSDGSEYARQQQTRRKGEQQPQRTARLCKFLGDISYPLYMVHYPFIYLYYAWVKNEGLTFAQSLPGAAALVAGSVLLAYLCLKLYDEPVRRLLTRRFLPTRR